MPADYFLTGCGWWNHNFGWTGDNLWLYWSPNASDPNRDCKLTTFATLADYAEAPSIWALPTDDEGGWPHFADGWQGSYHDRAQGGTCSEEIGSHSCWASPDAIDGQHCEG
ncbi:MAG: hypothetical protein KGZ25_06230 [Planctomycetes bacterium]|nr:hypothetical protein [Planctomycetota bacterium]